jgi:hypothetical protein
MAQRLHVHGSGCCTATEGVVHLRTMVVAPEGAVCLSITMVATAGEWVANLN